MALFLVSITLPNLREATPPEISGPSQGSPSQSSLDSPTYRTLTVDTSGKPGIPRLDDYPHLSPPMRELVRTWIAQCEETNQALDTITDPAQRAQVIAFLTNGRENMRKFLNCPLEWEELPYEEAYKHATEYLAQSLYNSEWPSGDLEEIRTVWGKEGGSSCSLSRRIALEFFAYNRQWNVAAELCVDNNESSHLLQESGYAPLNASTWNEEAYSWRQLGGRGLVCLTVRSCRRALENTPLESRHPTLYSTLNGVGMITLWKMRAGLDKTEPGESRKSPFPPSPLAPK
jgi:hypothetical protein